MRSTYNLFDVNVESIFATNFVGSSGVFSECHCGKTHVAMCSNDMSSYDPEDEGDEERARAYYEEYAKEDPNMILSYEDIDSFETVDISGRQFVIGCECEGWKPYMDFLLNDRWRIAGFLMHIAQDVKLAADKYDMWKRLEEV